MGHQGDGSSIRAARFVGATHPTVQLVTSDGFCFGATLDDVKRADATRLQARK